MDFSNLMQTQDQSGATAGTLVLTAYESARQEGEGPYEAARSAACVAFEICRTLHGDDAQALSAAHDAALWTLSLTPGYQPKYGSPYEDADHVRDEVWNRRSMCFGVAQRAKQKIQAQTARIEAGIEANMKKNVAQAQAAAKAQMQGMAGALESRARVAQNQIAVHAENEHNMNVALREFTGNTRADDELVEYALTCCYIAIQDGKVWSPSRYVAAFAAHTRPQAQSSVLSGLFPISLAALPGANIQLDVRGTPPIGTGYPGLSGMLDDFTDSLKSSTSQALKDLTGSAFKLGGDALKTGVQKVTASALATGQTKVAQKLGVSPESVTKQQLEQEMKKDPSIGQAMNQQAYQTQQQIRQQGLGTGAWIGIGAGAFVLLGLVITGIVLATRKPKAA